MLWLPECVIADQLAAVKQMKQCIPIFELKLHLYHRWADVMRSDKKKTFPKLEGESKQECVMMDFDWMKQNEKAGGGWKEESCSSCQGSVYTILTFSSVQAKFSLNRLTERTKIKTRNSEESRKKGRGKQCLIRDFRETWHRNRNPQMESGYYGAWGQK